MNRRIHLAVPPNIARKTRSEIAARFPAMEVGAPATHMEMYSFARTCGESPPPALSVSAYPQLARNVLGRAGNGRFRAPRGNLPALRPELAALGIEPPCPELLLIAVAPCVLVSNMQLLSGLEDWEDLCGPDVPAGVGTPPRDTPLPYLLEHYLKASYGKPASGLDTRSAPLDINKRVDRGDLAAGVLIPAFGRAFRDGGARMVWPRSGALAVPLAACLGGDSPPEADDVLEYLLSHEFQTFLAESGGLVPVRAGVPGFPELDDAGWRLNWPGWDTLLTVAETMNRMLAG
jgi:hypothetical protein